jgi:hypothetical protein
MELIFLVIKTRHNLRHEEKRPVGWSGGQVCHLPFTSGTFSLALFSSDKLLLLQPVPLGVFLFRFFDRSRRCDNAFSWRRCRKPAGLRVASSGNRTIVWHQFELRRFDRNAAADHLLWR